MNLVLERFAYMSDRTRGKLYVEDKIFQTVEKPWVPTAAHNGGIPFQSCIPDGYYNVTPFTRPSGDKVWQLENPGLDVYLQESDLPPDGGRYLILIHAGNTVNDVVGCIAPGLTGDEQKVISSRAAVVILSEVLGHKSSHTLHIKPRGAVNKV